MNVKCTGIFNNEVEIILQRVNLISCLDFLAKSVFAISFSNQPQNPSYCAALTHFYLKYQNVLMIAATGRDENLCSETQRRSNKFPRSKIEQNLNNCLRMKSQRFDKYKGKYLRETEASQSLSSLIQDSFMFLVQLVLRGGRVKYAHGYN